MQDASDSQATTRPRILTADRGQTDPYPKTIDELIPKKHQARDVWEMVEQLDYQPLLDQIQSREGLAGRPGIDPRILIALWLYATIEGVAEGRALARLVKYHDAYKWIAGGVGVCHATLSNFRTSHNDWLSNQVVGVVAKLTQEGLIDFKQVAQDGMRVRACAGSSSFKTENKLDELLKQAQQRWDALEEQFREAQSPADKRKQATQRRAARERIERLQRAKEQRDEIAKSREKRKKGDGGAARASTTDPQARRMKMADGGYRPALNVQYATLLGSLLIVGVMVINAGGDSGQMTPMIDQIEASYGRLPEEYYADGSYSNVADIERTEQRGITTYLPVKKATNHPDRYAARPSDSETIKYWRARMGSAEGQQKYKHRSVCEWSNAESRRHGINRLVVRGLEKAKSVALWHALTQNLTRARSLRAAKN